MTAERLIMGLPSKGRLQENAVAFLADAGMEVAQRQGRDYTGKLNGVDNVDIVFLSASEIAKSLEKGRIHFGMTGEDLIREKIPCPEDEVVFVLPLGFGYADVVVAVPQSWIDVDVMTDLDDVALTFRHRKGRRMRVATKYINLTRNFFARNGIMDYRIVESLGATEGVPASGTAEAIVDITSTGATLAANDLKALDDGVILRSQASLVASRRAKWTSSVLEAAGTMLDMIDAREQAKAHYLASAYIGKDIAAAAVKAGQAVVPGVMIQQMPAGEAVALSAVGPKTHIGRLAKALRAEGAETVTVTQTEYVFSAKSGLSGRFLSQIGA